MSSAAMPTAAAPMPSAALALACRHCGGSGREPHAPLALDLTRGEQVRMATELGISTSQLSRILAGHRGPGLLTLIRIARRYHTTVDRVLRIPAIWRRVHSATE